AVLTVTYADEQVSVHTNDLLNRRALESLDRRPGQDRMDPARQNAAGALALYGCHRLDQRAGRVDHVVDDDGVAALDVTDQVHGDRGVRPLAPLVDDGQTGVEPLGHGAGPLHAPRVRRDDDGVCELLFLRV